MKIVLDLSDLVESGRLTAAEAERLRGLAAVNAGSLALNLLVGFGLAAVAAGIGALIPSAVTAVALGAVLAIAGAALMTTYPKAWDLLAQMCIVIGALAFCGGVCVLDEGSLRSILFGVVLLTLGAILVRSGFLIAIAVLAVGACLGSSTDYHHALYSLSVEEPTLTVLVFAAIALAGYLISLRMPAAYERLALIAARVAVLSVNFGFWVGSLWGDDLTRLRAWLNHTGAVSRTSDAAVISPVAFSIAWALALIAAGFWAYREGRLWVVNTVAVFGALHFYTQWFEVLGANPAAVLGAGLLMLAISLGLWRLNRHRPEPLAA